MCANPYYDNDKKKVKAIETSEILFSCLRFLVNALQDLFYSQNSGGKINLKLWDKGVPRSGLWGTDYIYFYDLSCLSFGIKEIKNHVLRLTANVRFKFRISQLGN